MTRTEAERRVIEAARGLTNACPISSGWVHYPQVNTLRKALAVIDALADTGEAEGWRPISEYPRDHDPGPDTYWGPNVLLFVPTGMIAPASDYRIVTGRLEADMWLGWDTDGSMYDIRGVPSHWHSLPAPPASGEG